MNLKMLFAVFSIVLSFVGVFGEKEAVPVLVWSTQRLPDETFPGVSALEHVSYKAFKTDYLTSFNLKNVLVFLQDELSVEDLSSNEGTFTRIESAMKNRQSLYIPLVYDASFMVKDLSAEGYNLIEVESEKGFGGIHLKKDENNLVVVKLPATANVPLRKNVLQKADEVMAAALSKLSDLAEFTVVYTATSQTGFMSGKTLHRVARQTEPIITDIVKHFQGFYAAKCVMAYFRGEVNVYDRKNNATYILINDENVEATADCQALTNSMTLSYRNLKALDKLKVEYNFDLKSGRRWVLTFADVYAGDSDKHELLYPIREMGSVPVKKSYSCAQKLVLRSNGTNLNETRFEMRINGIQIQAFTPNGTVKFGDSWDCVGFFTIPIWMGLLSSLLGLIILLMGLYMLSEVKTMDRFDDPKGKHIMVHALAD